MIRVTNNTNNNNGIGFTGVLQVTFIVLKLCKVINWKWIWVLAPSWIAIIVAILALIFMIIVGD